MATCSVHKDVAVFSNKIGVGTLVAVVASKSAVAAPVAVPAWVVRRRGAGIPSIAFALVVVSVGGRRGAVAVAVAPVPSTVIAIVPVPTSSATDVRPATGRGIPLAFAVGAAVPSRAIPIGCSAAFGRGDAAAPVESAWGVPMASCVHKDWRHCHQHHGRQCTAELHVVPAGSGGCCCCCCTAAAALQQQQQQRE